MRVYFFKSLLVIGICVLVAGCTESPLVFASLSDSEQQSAMQKWQRSCALCHVDGNGGAPKIGDREAWSSRIRQSEQVLLSHTIEGLGRMPPLGYCMDCTEQDFLYLTGFMAGEIEP